MAVLINLFDHDINNFVASGVLITNTPASGTLITNTFGLNEIKRVGQNLLNEFNWEEDTSPETAYEILKNLAYYFAVYPKVGVVINCDGIICANEDIIKKVNSNEFREHVIGDDMKIIFKKSYRKSSYDNSLICWENIALRTVFSERVDLICENRENI